VDEVFEDPRLKAAVRRVWDVDSASASLRARVERTFRDEAPTPVVRQPRQPLRMPRLIPGRWPGFAIAATVLLTFGTGAWMLTNGDQTDKPATFPYTLVAGIVQAHDHLRQAPNEHFLPGDVAGDFTAIGSKLSDELHIPVLSAPMNNWRFIGASRVMVLEHPAANLLYRDGNRTLSILSMPTSVANANAYDEHYVVTMGTHQIAGFTKYGALYCIVIDSPNDGSTTDQARLLRNQLQQDFPAVFAEVSPRPHEVVYGPAGS
jgi:hypothetical protein